MTAIVIASIRKTVKKMAEQRLIDANALHEDWLENGENEYIYDTNSFLSSLDDAPTIDPETLPIVQELREELARVTAERDDYKELFFLYRNVCGGHDPQRISELVEADKDGRCVVLPCKVGTPVYWVVDGGVFECYLNLAAVEEVGKTVFLTREAAEAALAKEAK